VIELQLRKYWRLGIFSNRAADTRTGVVLERMILPALENGHYSVRTHVSVGTRLGGGTHIVDAVATRADGRLIIISLKWRQVSGTAEQKVPFEVICLEEALKSGIYEKTYVVLGGEGWKLRTFIRVEHYKYTCDSLGRFRFLLWSLSSLRRIRGNCESERL
jgi:hypothetical protein